MDVDQLNDPERAGACGGPDTSLVDATGLIERYGCGAVFVVDAARRLVGVVTDGDLRRHAARGGGLESATLREVMTASPVHVASGSSAVEAYRTAQRRAINVMAIVDAEQRFAGFATFHELSGVLSPERIYPTSLDYRSMTESERKHLARYRLARAFVGKGARVLDAACGVGYGAKLFAECAASVLAVDRDDEALDHAQRVFADPVIEYRQSDIDELDFGDSSFDVIVSLETLEHLDPDVSERFLRRMTRWLAPEGVIVASTPMLRFKDGKPYVTNPHHINEMPREHFLGMVRGIFPGYVLQFVHQRGECFAPLDREDTGMLVMVARKCDNGPSLTGGGTA